MYPCDSDSGFLICTLIAHFSPLRSPLRGDEREIYLIYVSYFPTRRVANIKYRLEDNER